MKHFFVLAIYILTQLIGNSANAQQDTTKKLTLKQAVETGIANNLEVQQNGLLVKTSEINWKQSKLNLLPDLNGSVDNGINQGRSIDPFTNGYINQNVSFSSYGLSSGVILFNGLLLQNTIKQNSLSYQASKMDWQQAKDNITINIILAYLQVLTNEDLLAQARNQEDLTTKQVERLEILNNDGAIVPSLLSDLKGQLATDQLTIVNTQNTLETARISLCQLMNVPYYKSMTLERLDTDTFADQYEDVPDKIYQTALERFALVKAVELRKRSAEKGVSVARGALFPTLSLNGNLNTNYSNAARNDVFINTTDITSTDYVVVNGTQTPVIRKQDNFTSQKIGYGKQLNGNLFSTISLNLQIPIFNALFARNRVKLAKITLKNTQLIESSTKTELQQNIEQAYVNMTSARDRYKIILGQVSAYTESFRAADIRFNSGVGTSIDYTTAKNNVDRANINLINAKYDAVLRSKILDYYQGKNLW